ncbi:hypothetical protein EJC47_15870 [Sphingomonas sp. TF3]|uniref:Rap1a/Tai family immunity protein n=1 Tax=Sphingomonas sp. TF3 TaxID=2495580 RepID=UPI000F88C42D|nr:Rap1a/Tai family immunity protein [Sphingomonas sp. TF3]RUN75503.1 hypothetical protein EJC47_15870 [Sphingomonas sp. TF3]
MIALFALAAALSLAPDEDPITASRGQMTLGDLQVLCADREPGEACRFYILGVMEGTNLASGVANDTKHFCIPEGVTQTEIVAVVKRLAKGDVAMFPKDVTMPAVSFVGASLIHSYPCAKK